MNRKKSATAATAAVVIWVLLAGFGFNAWIVQRHPSPARLAGLVVATPPPGFTKKPASSNAVTAASNPLAAYKAAAKRSPSQTASWSKSWSSPKSTNESASVWISRLPTATQASSALTQAEGQYLGANSFKSESYVLVGPVPVSGIPGARAAVFKPSSGTATPPVAAAVFAVDRVQVLVIVGVVGTPQSAGSTAAALARSEYAQLERDLPSFHLGVTHVPTVATIVYWGVVAGVVTLAVVVPVTVRRTRRRRVEQQRRVAARQHQVRGSKIARRQAVRRR